MTLYDKKPFTFQSPFGPGECNTHVEVLDDGETKVHMDIAHEYLATVHEYISTHPTGNAMELVSMLFEAGVSCGKQLVLALAEREDEIDDDLPEDIIAAYPFSLLYSPQDILDARGLSA